MQGKHTKFIYRSDIWQLSVPRVVPIEILNLLYFEEFAVKRIKEMSKFMFDSYYELLYIHTSVNNKTHNFTHNKLYQQLTIYTCI